METKTQTTMKESGTKEVEIGGGGAGTSRQVSCFLGSLVQVFLGVAFNQNQYGLKYTF